MKEILIGGVVYGLHNIGDEAILMSMLNNFDDKANITVATYSSDWIDTQYKDVKRIPITEVYRKPKVGIYVGPNNRNPINLVKNIWKGICPNKKPYTGKDLYICGGATILSDCPWHSLRTTEVASKAGVESILWCVGMAEVKSEQTISYIKESCNKNYLKHIYVRDEYVKERLVGIGVNRDKVSVSYDSAIMLEPSKLDLKKYLNEREIALYNDENINIGISLSGEMDIKGQTSLDEIAKLVDMYIEKYNANIFFVPTGCGEHCEDRALMKSLCKGEKTAFVEKEMEPRDLIAFEQNIKFSVSSRLHYNILGAIAGMPSIGLIRNTKIIDFANLLDLKTFELSALDAKSIFEYGEHILNNYDEVTEKINKKVEYMRDVQKKCVNEVISKYF